ncbi:DNA polymerase III subunit delta' [Vibrio sp. 99-70-13A1]|uniref:DNA polymerase III subunit delta' n=1 Tax=Vibrio sp. 99-70-13A1 TaxID=2607601 RepID=UPI0014937015|nr:DNA polymerase III subunit delta' [Vibrio sp. 99-70-13A1]NOH95361.1 DNA polymerase III subunit delta' [Vibrio sp. 99-70-13A1]
MGQLYPWLEPIWGDWQKSLNAERFPNAMLVNGPDGLGVSTLLEQLSAALMCTNYESEACGFCHSCELVKSGSHPDLHFIQPEKEGKAITVEQIRSSNRWALESSQLGGYRVIMITPADAMNEASSNALLKTLEEPSSKCIFVLTTSNISRLMPTIRSRCQQTTVTSPSMKSASEWLDKELRKAVPAYVLSLANNAPLTAKSMVENGDVEACDKTLRQFVQIVDGSDVDLMSFATTLSKEPLKHLTWIWHLLSDVQKIHFGIESESFIPSSQELKDALNYQNAFKLSKTLTSLIEQLKQHPGLNTELLIMNWLITVCGEACS